jgi:NADPH:quinone reductase-like Zn-dependent oxidoreductase
MKAVVFHEYGGLNVLKYEDVPTPEIGPEEVLIRVRAAGLNRLDLVIRGGLTPAKAPLPHICGSEVAGEIAELGEKVSGFELGQRVVVAPYLHDGTCDYCRAGEEVLCDNGDILGLGWDGGYAEYVKVPANSLVGLPENLTFEEGAAQALSTLTAWRVLVTKAGVRPGEVVLVHSAGSGVGSAAVQIAKLWGAKVIATASTNEKLEKAKEIGADEIINYAEQNFLQEVRRITGRRGVDIVVEHIGQETWERSLSCVGKGGRLVVCGTTSGGDGRLSLSNLLAKEVMVIGSYGGTSDELKQVLRLSEEGRIAPIIDTTFPLHEAAEAQRRLEDRNHFGKVLLIP